MTETDERAAAIRRLNDAFRSTFVGGRIALSGSVLRLNIDLRREIIRAVQTYTAWEAGDDLGHHDFGEVEVRGHKVTWQIECLDTQLQQPSPDPSDAKVSRRVLSIEFASEA